MFWNASLQVYCVSFVIFCSVVVHAVILPYNVMAHNIQELASLFVCFTTYFATYALRENLASEGWQVIAVIMVGLLNSLLVIYMVFSYVRNKSAARILSRRKKKASLAKAEQIVHPASN